MSQIVVAPSYLLGLFVHMPWPPPHPSPAHTHLLSSNEQLPSDSVLIVDKGKIDGRTKNQNINKRIIDVMVVIIFIWFMLSDMQALVYQLRTIWYKVSSFDVEKFGQFLNPQPAFSFK